MGFLIEIEEEAAELSESNEYLLDVFNIPDDWSHMNRRKQFIKLAAIAFNEIRKEINDG